MAEQLSKADVKKARKADALALAELIYDIFMEEDGKTNSGQNNAQNLSTG